MTQRHLQLRWLALSLAASLSLGLLQPASSQVKKDPPPPPPSPIPAARPTQQLTLAASTNVENYSYLQGLAPLGDDAVTVHGPQMLGDKVNLFTGALEFEHTDLDLPGNSKLSVAVTRKHIAGRSRPSGVFGNWDLELPRISGNFSNSLGWVTTSGTTARCSSFSAPPYIGFVSAFEYWQGTFLNVPGEGGQEVLQRAAGNSAAPADGNAYPLVTRGQWQIRCLASIQNGTGEGFVARSPAGVEYRFDWLATRSLYSVMNQTTTVARSEFMMLATQVTDRFGNWVRYTYDAANPARLTSIAANDGRAISLGYTATGYIGSVSDGSRAWTYTYSGADLTAAVQPDGGRWEFNLTPLVHPIRVELGEGATCNYTGSYPDLTYVGTVKHPSGLLGAFATQFIYRNRSNVSRLCFGPLPAGAGAVWPQTLVSQGLTSKTLSGPGLAAATWTYAHGGGAASWAPCNPCADTKTVTVTDPRGAQTRHTFGVRFQSNEGQLLSVGEGWNGTTALRTSTYRYRAPAGMPYPEPPGNSIQYAPDFLSIRHRPQDQRVTTQQGTTFTWNVNAFDSLARATSVSRFSSQGNTRTDTTAYYDHMGKWVLGQLASVTNSLGPVPESHSYDATTALRTASYAFGRLTESLSYLPDGNVYARIDPAGRATYFTNYMRGRAQNVSYPDATAESALVNNLGNLNSWTNAAGTTTFYTYDAMGRLASTTPPGGDAVAYFPTTRVFEPVAAVEYGIAGGHWRETVTTGNAQSVRYFDALWRERLTRTSDVANAAGTSRMVEMRYDAEGRKLFQSYPQRGIAAVDGALAGSAWAHDALGRVIGQYQDSELGLLTSTTSYPANAFQRVVTNARGYSTTFAFQAFDTPSDDAIASVSAPEGQSLSIARDVFGKPLAITRSGSYGGSGISATRSYVYDANQRLCKTIEPETAANVQTYDAANNIAWRASGLALYGTTTCDQASVPAARMVGYAYDTRNRLTGTTYGDGSRGIGRNYTADGLPYQVWSNGSTWTLAYNNRRLLRQESLAIAGATYTFDRGIDANGNLASLAYPGGPTLAYSPNALGQPTQVSGYASAVTYHPNGMLAGYTLANGITHSTTQNTRGLPGLWRDAGVVQDLYAFDANANVTAITDQQEGLSSRSMGYDGLDRLASASGIWGSGAFGYDPLDNLRTSTVGSRLAVAAIDAANRLSSLTINGVAQSYGYDANGNLTQRGAQAFGFDIGNRLTSAAGKASYAYDGLGRRTWVAYAAGSTKLQVYSQAGKLLYSGHSAQGNTRHIHLGERLIAEVNSITGTSYSHTDALGSPIAKTNASGQLLSRTRYEPYGATAAGTNPTGIGFTGHVNDADTGLVYMQQRYYEPIAGRFLSVDPVTTDTKSGDHFNRYAYADNNPYKFIDPDGRNPVIAAIVRVLLAIGGKEAAKSGAREGTKGAARAEGAAGKSHTTYTREKSDGTVYSGKTSGKGTPEEQVANRTGKPDHKAKTEEGYGPANVDKNSTNSDAVRGREQQLIETNGGAQSQGGTSGNKINGVAADNPKAPVYQEAAKNEFGSK